MNQLLFIMARLASWGFTVKLYSKQVFMAIPHRSARANDGAGLHTEVSQARHMKTESR
jgi:hypothetical protein